MDAVVVLSPLAAPAVAHSPKRSARRCLFGRPDPGVAEKWLAKRFEEIHAQQVSKWSFDFDAEVPCPSATSDYIFSAVPANSVPHFYRPSCYPKHSPANLDSENRIPTSDDSDCSMVDESTVTSFPKSTRTAKNQSKLTAFMPVKSRKRLQHCAKSSDLCGSDRRSSAKSSPRRLKGASQ